MQQKEPRNEGKKGKASSKIGRVLNEERVRIKGSPWADWRTRLTSVFQSFSSLKRGKKSATK